MVKGKDEREMKKAVRKVYEAFDAVYHEVIYRKVFIVAICISLSAVFFFVALLIEAVLEVFLILTIILSILIGLFIRKKRAEEILRAALVRMYLRDGPYTFKEVIDGDTLIVYPPKKLIEFGACDIRIRLYGVDAPERSDELGPIYRRLLESLCKNTPNGQLLIIWERERLGTRYPDVPRISFERCIGNVFIKVDGYLLYVNSFLAMLPHVYTFRDEHDLIRGRQRLRKWLHFDPWHGGCGTQLPEQILVNLVEILGIEPEHEFRFPVCLCLFPGEIIPAEVWNLPLEGIPPNEVWNLLLESIQSHNCPYTQVAELAREIKINNLIESRIISPFDVPLLLASNWKGEAENPEKLSVKECYKRIYDWHIRYGKTKVKKSRFRDDLKKKYLNLVDAIPPPHKATQGDMDFVFGEVISGLMEWSYGEEDEYNIKMCAYAESAFYSQYTGGYDKRYYESRKTSKLSQL